MLEPNDQLKANNSLDEKSFISKILYLNIDILGTKVLLKELKSWNFGSKKGQSGHPDVFPLWKGANHSDERKGRVKKRAHLFSERGNERTREENIYLFIFPSLNARNVGHVWPRFSLLFLLRLGRKQHPSLLLRRLASLSGLPTWHCFQCQI